MIRRFALLAGVLAGGAAWAGDGSDTAAIDQPVKDFRLKDVMKDEESFVALSEFKDKKHVAIVFISYNCDVTWRYEKRIGKLLQDYGKKDVAFLAVRSSASDTAEGIRKYAEAKNIAMPVLFDDGNLMADYFGVAVTPSFFLIDRKGVLRYQGSCDDNMDEQAATQRYFRAALDAVLADKEVETRETEAFG
jgi:peroxiredoxin